MNSTIYLTGSHLDPTAWVGQTPEPDWRSLACNRLQMHGLKVLNPLEYAWSSTQLEQNHESRVRKSLELIDQCDALLANIERSSWGTAMEMFYAFRRGKQVTVIGQSPFSPWVVSHSQARFGDLEQALDFIIGEPPQFDPLAFALQYETKLAEHAEEFPPEGELDYHFLGGDVPILVVAPHATGFFHEGDFHEPQAFTGSLAAVLNRLARCHALLTSYCCAADPCHYLETPMLRALIDVVKAGEIRLILFLLGGSGNQTHGLTVTELGQSTGVLKDFASWMRLDLSALGPVGQSTDKPAHLAKFVSGSLGIPSVILNMHRRYRMPKLQPQPFVKIVDKMSALLQKAGSELIRSAK